MRMKLERHTAPAPWPQAKNKLRGILHVCTMGNVQIPPSRQKYDHMLAKRKIKSLFLCSPRFLDTLPVIGSRPKRHPCRTSLPQESSTLSHAFDEHPAPQPHQSIHTAESDLSPPSPLPPRLVPLLLLPLLAPLPLPPLDPLRPLRLRHAL